MVKRFNYRTISKLDKIKLWDSFFISNYYKGKRQKEIKKVN